MSELLPEFYSEDIRLVEIPKQIGQGALELALRPLTWGTKLLSAEAAPDPAPAAQPVDYEILEDQ